MNAVQTVAIVIKVMDFAESDKIVTLFSEQIGKINCIAKGAKRSKKRFVNKLEFFSQLDSTLSRSRHSTLYRIDGAELLTPHLALREQYQRYTAAMLVCELVDLWTREQDHEPALYHLLHWCLQELCTTSDAPTTTALFHLKLLQIVGFYPQLEQCLHCGAVPHIGASAVRFSPTENGIICSDCSPTTSSTSTRLSIAALKTLQMLHTLPNEKLTRIKIAPATVTEISTMLQHVSRHHLQRDIISWRQLSPPSQFSPGRKKI